ncbi:GMC oxidoreductase [Ramaria rubella]|nr:GMC oxidoreductase [Ramaria rubella]
MGSSFSSQSPFVKNPSVYATEVQEKKNPSQVRVYDYIIVGGGPAACVLAHRLTEDPTTSVLLIEAGKGYQGHLFSKIPLTFAKTFKTEIDWGYLTTKQEKADGRSFYWPAGKVLGGGSMVNALMYQRPCEDDIKEWVRLGANDWEWEGDFKQYLNKAEKYTLHPSRPNTDSSHRGNAGNWQTSHPDHLPISGKFLDACERIGIPKIMDTSRPQGPLGASFVSAFIDKKGQRSSAAHAYLTPAVLKRVNLTVAVETTVTRILFSTLSGTPHATGVELTRGPGMPLYQANVRREVLCCAGAIKTPQILTLSGIGPTEDLERLGIPVVRELEAVGRNLCDHLVATVGFRAKRGTTLDPLVTPKGGIMPMLRWLLTGRGPFATLTGQAYAFVKSTDPTLPFDKDPSDHAKVMDVSAGNASPDIEYIIAPVSFKAHEYVQGPATYTCTIGTILLRPQSAGTLTLKSANIWDGADINPNYFTAENDMVTLVRGVRLSLRMARSPPLAEQLLLKDDAEDSNDLYFPGDANPDTISDEVLRRYISSTAETLYHPMCTARIGRSPTDSVVNHELRVHGVSNLRIIDASVFPAPFPGHPCATIIALGEKVADMLKATPS